MHHASVSSLFSLTVIAALPVIAGEATYNPGAPSNSEALKKTPMSYYCTSQGINDGKWYITGFESAPGFGTTQYSTFEADSSQAYTQYMNATYGRNKVMYSHCTVGASKSLRPSWEQMQHDPSYKETVHVNWRYGQSSTPTADNASASAPETSQLPASSLPVQGSPAHAAISDAEKAREELKKILGH